MDIDIDISPKFEIDEIFKGIQHASIVENGKLKKHLVGVYFQNIPIDKETQLSAIPYDKADDEGFKKIDILNLKILSNFSSKAQIKQILAEEPDWTMLTYEEVVNELFHLSGHFDVVDKIVPKSISELADVLALIRPNKIKLINKYLNNKKETIKELYVKNSPSDLRKSHAIPYAMIIILNMWLIKKGIL